MNIDSRLRTLSFIAVWFMPACIPDAPKVGMKEEPTQVEGGAGGKRPPDEQMAPNTKGQGGASPIGSAGEKSQGGAPAAGGNGGSGGRGATAHQPSVPSAGSEARPMTMSTPATAECFLEFKDNECGHCMSSKCDASCIDCGADDMCRDAFSCILSCATDTRCLDDCVSTLDKRAQQRISSLVQCFDGCSAACGMRRIGDACTSSEQCSGACAASACTNVCAKDVDCGTSSAGRANLCLDSADGRRFCYPSCSSNADCAQFPGRVCVTNGTWSVCATAPTMSQMSSTCESCLAAECSTEVDVCGADAGCKAYILCECNPGDTACQQRCIDALPASSAPLVQQLSACIETRCGSSCK